MFASNLPINAYDNPAHYIVFDEIGRMASSMSYIHVVVPLNITNMYDQANFLKNYFETLSKETTTDIKMVPKTKALQDIANIMIPKISRTIQRLNHLNHILPNQDTLLPRHKRYVQAVIQSAIIPFAAAIRSGTKQKPPPLWISDQEIDMDRIYRARSDINDYKKSIAWFNKQTTPLPNYPDHFWAAFKTPPTTTTTPYPDRLNTESEYNYLKTQRTHYGNIWMTLYRESESRRRQTTTIYVPKTSIYNPNTIQQILRPKRFLVAAGAMVGVLGTFMGIYSQIQINKLQTELGDLANKHNMLIQVTDKHEVMLMDLIESMEGVIETLNYMNEYNPGLIYAQINEQVVEFMERITKLENAVQQLQHRRLAVDLLDKDQLKVLHEAVLQLAAKEGYQILPERIGDYFQIEVSYLRTGQDIDILVHVPCVKPNSLLTIFKYVPFPFPLPNTTTKSDLSIAHSVNLHQLTLEEAIGVFQNNTSYDTNSEALFVSEESSLIAIGRDHRFRLTTQADLASCIQRNHVYLCDKHQVLRTDLERNCLGALYLRHASGVRTYCRFERRPLTENVYQLTNIDHLVFTPTPLTTQVMCQNGSVHPIFLAQTSKLTVPQNCHVTLRSHVIFSDAHFDASPPPLQYAWHWDPRAMPSHLLDGNLHLDQQIQSLRNHLYHTKQHAVNKTNFSSLLMGEISTGSAAYLFWPFVLLSLSVILGLGIWCWCRNRKPKPRSKRRNSAWDLVPSPRHHEQQMIVIRPTSKPDPDSSEDEISRIARTT